MALRMTSAPVLHETLPALIQASLAPVFLLTANASTLILIDTRQNRIVDRLRILEAQVLSQGGTSARIDEEVAFYMTRVRRVGRAAAACTLSGLGVALAVVGLFFDAQVSVSLAILVEAMFTLAVLAYVAALAIYLKDVVAVNDGLGFMQGTIAAALEARRKRGP
jgi:Protein of unknown function (DUF2721)